MAVDQPPLDSRVFPVGERRQRLGPSVAVHATQVVADAAAVPGDVENVDGHDTIEVMADPLCSLIEAAVEGDDRATEAFVERTRGAVWSVCARLGSPGDTEDLVQEVYLRAVRSMSSYRGDAPVLAWLMTIARRTCADEVRRRQRRRRLDERIRTQPLELVAPPPEASSDLLDHLDDDRRSAFVLTQLAGLPYAEAAEALGCPIGTVRSRVARARADLLALVEGDRAAADEIGSQTGA